MKYEILRITMDVTIIDFLAENMIFWFKQCIRFNGMVFGLKDEHGKFAFVPRGSETQSVKIEHDETIDTTLEHMRSKNQVRCPPYITHVHQLFYRVLFH